MRAAVHLLLVILKRALVRRAMGLMDEASIRVHERSLSILFQCLCLVYFHKKTMGGGFPLFVYPRIFHTVSTTLVATSGPTPSYSTTWRVYTIRLPYPLPKTVAEDLSSRFMLARDGGMDALDFLGAGKMPPVASQSRDTPSLCRAFYESSSGVPVSSQFAHVFLANAKRFQRLDAKERPQREN